MADKGAATVSQWHPPCHMKPKKAAMRVNMLFGFPALGCRVVSCFLSRDCQDREEGTARDLVEVAGPSQADKLSCPGDPSPIEQVTPLPEAEMVDTPSWSCISLR